MAGDVTSYLNLLTSEHVDKPNFTAMVAATCQPFADQTSVELTIPSLYDVDNAVGSQLDAVGQWVGVTRQLSAPLSGVYFAFDTAGVGFDQGVWMGPYDPATGLVSLPDEQYRTVIRARILNNHWDGSLVNAYALANAIFARSGYSLFLIDHTDMSIDMGLVGATTPDVLTLALFTSGKFNVKLAGVRIASYQYQQSPGPLFAFDLGSYLSFSVPPSIYKTDWQGQWLQSTSSRTNLLTFSERFDNSIWVKNGTAFAEANVALSPDGMFTTEAIGLPALNDNVAQYSLGSAGSTYAFSLWLWGTGSVAIFFYDDVNGYQSSLITLTSTPTRYQISKTFGIGSVDRRCGIGKLGAATASLVYAFGTQFETGSVASSYIPSSDTFTSRASTATYFDATGTMQTAAINVARYGYGYDVASASWKSMGLILEAAATNLLTYSNVFSDASWLKVGTYSAVQNAIGPDGLTSAWTLTDADAVNAVQIYKDTTIAADTLTRCQSIFIQKTTGATTAPIIRFVFASGTFRYTSIVLNTNDGTSIAEFGIGLPDYYGVTDYGTYWHVWGAITNDGTHTTFRVMIFPSAASIPLTGVKINTLTGSIVAAFPQLELGTFPTSYMDSGASPAARSADVASSTSVSTVDYVDDGNGDITFVVAPVAGSALEWSGTGTDSATGLSVVGSSAPFGTPDGTQRSFQILPPSAAHENFAGLDVGSWAKIVTN